MKKKSNTDNLPTAPTLVGKNIYLRPAEAEDYRITYQWFLASDPQSQTCHDVKLASPDEIVERMRRKEPDRTEGDFMVVRNVDDALIGKIKFFHLNMLNRSAEIGYIIDPAERENGYGKESVRLLVRYLFDYFNLNKVYAQTSSFNKASIKLLESLDFKLDGTLRQHHYYRGDLYDDLIYSLLRFEFS